MADTTGADRDSPSETISGVSVITQATETPAAESTPQPDVTPTSPVADSAENPSDGSDATGNLDPVQEAIAHLTGEPAQAVPAKPETLAKDPAPDADGRLRAPDGTFATKTADKAPDKPAEPRRDQQSVIGEDPFEGFSEAERRALSVKTKDRISNLLWQRNEAESKATKALPDDPLARDFSELAKREKLDDDLAVIPPEHFAGIIRVQSSINRAAIALQQGRQPAPNDLQMVSQTMQQLQAMAQRFGIEDVARATSPPIEPLAGDLPFGYQQLVDVYGLPEKQVRLLAAIEANQKGQPQQDAKPQAPAQPPPQAPQHFQPQRQVGVDFEQVYQDRRDAEMIRAGISREHIAAHLAVIKPQIVAEMQLRYPTVQGEQIAQVFNALPPKDRCEITLTAHRNMSGQRPSSSPTAPPPTRAAATRSLAPPRRSAPVPSGDSVADAIAHLTMTE